MYRLIGTLAAVSLLDAIFNPWQNCCCCRPCRRQGWW